ncbi:MAG: dihydrodipicolinate synthase family protein, partial [Candidatus Nanopelagicales bacterium]
MSITGILVALVTPFTDDFAVDDAGIQRHVDRMVAAGIHGLVPLGTTGEFTTMTHAERRHVTDAVIEAAAGRIPVFPHTGA